MADAKLSALPVGAPVGGLDLFYSDQGGVSVSQSGTALATFLSGGGTPSLPNNSVQYNNAGAFGGAANFTITAGNPDVSAAGTYRYDGQEFLRGDVGGFDSWYAGNSGTGATGFGNTTFGWNALSSGPNTGGFNVAFGFAAMQKNTSGQNNVGIGSAALFNVTIGIDNCCIGTNAGDSITAAQFNTAIGSLALRHTDADGNVGIGYSAGLNNTNGVNNTFIGDFAGGNGGPALNGFQNTCIGYQAGYSINGGATQNIAIGYFNELASSTGNAQLVIGNYIYGTGLTGTSTTISPGKIGIGIKAPAVELDVAGSVKTASSIVSSLPAPGNIGARNFVTDALGPAFGAPVVGLGGVKVPVYDDGTQWVVG